MILEISCGLMQGIDSNSKYNFSVKHQRTAIQVAHVSMVIVRYNLMAYIKRFHDYETIGALGPTVYIFAFSQANGCFDAVALCLKQKNTPITYKLPIYSYSTRLIQATLPTNGD